MEDGIRKRGGRGPGVALPGLRDARIGREMTVRGLAEKASVSPTTISLLENGRRGAQRSTIKRLHEALEVGVEALTGAREEAHGASPVGDAVALKSLWAEERGVSEEEAERQIRARREELARGARVGRRRMGLAPGERVVLRGGGLTAASDAVSAVRGS